MKTLGTTPPDRDPAEIDRISPTLRPTGKPLMLHRWAHLLFLHWAVPPAYFEGCLPPGLTLDTYQGRAYIGLIPFTMTGIRPPWLPAIPGLSNSHETNLRTYVHRDGRDPGVWFFSLDASNPFAVMMTRALWNLPYFYSRMSVNRDGSGQIVYRSERLRPPPAPAIADIACRPHGRPAPSLPATLEFFLLERYYLYGYRRGCLLRGQVHHTAYPVQPAEVLNLQESILAAAGFHRPPEAPLVHYAEELHVEVFPIRPVAG